MNVAITSNISTRTQSFQGSYPISIIHWYHFHLDKSEVFAVPEVMEEERYNQLFYYAKTLLQYPANDYFLDQILTKIAWQIAGQF